MRATRTTAWGNAEVAKIDTTENFVSFRMEDGWVGRKAVKQRFTLRLSLLARPPVSARLGHAPPFPVLLMTAAVIHFDSRSFQESVAGIPIERDYREREYKIFDGENDRILRVEVSKKIYSSRFDLK